MNATAWEFKYRLWISFAIIGLGFGAPWIEAFHLDSRAIHTWGWLAFQLGALGIPSAAGFKLLAALAIAASAVGAALRIWGTAYLGTATVFNAEMKPGAEKSSGRVLADGPFRYMRNPLYIGSLLTNGSLALLMPPSGATVSLPLLGFFLLRLILGEEAFLKPRLGEPYAEYCQAVPRLFPSVRPRVPAGGQPANWGQAFLGEIFPIGVVISFAALSWQYDPLLLIRAVVVCFGISLVVRALILPRPQPLQPES